MDKREYYKKYYKVIKWAAFILILIFYPVLYADSQDKIVGYGLCDNSHIVIGTEDKKISVFDLEGEVVKIFSIADIADDYPYSMYLQDGIYIFPNRSDTGYLYAADGRLIESGNAEVYWKKLDIAGVVTPEAARRQNRTNLEDSRFMGMRKITLHVNGEEKVLFQTDTTEYVIKFFAYLLAVISIVGVSLGAVRRQYVDEA